MEEFVGLESVGLTAVAIFVFAVVLLWLMVKSVPQGEDWTVVDRGEEVFRAPLSDFRVSVLWKADVYRDGAERDRGKQDPLALEQVAAIFDEDLRAKGESERFDLDRIEDPEFAAWLAGFYPEAKPVGVGRTIYDAA